MITLAVCELGIIWEAGGEHQLQRNWRKVAEAMTVQKMMVAWTMVIMPVERRGCAKEHF